MASKLIILAILAVVAMVMAETENKKRYGGIRPGKVDGPGHPGYNPNGQPTYPNGQPGYPNGNNGYYPTGQPGLPGNAYFPDGPEGIPSNMQPGNLGGYPNKPGHGGWPNGGYKSNGY